MASGQEMRSLDGHRRGHVAFSPDGSFLVSSGLHANATIYCCATWQAMCTLPETANAWGSAFVPDGSRLATVQPQSPIQLWNTVNWQLEGQIGIDIDYVYALAFAPDGDTLALALPENGLVRVHRADTLEELTAFTAHQPFTYGLAFSPDGTKLATGGADGVLRLWRTSDWRNHLQLECGGLVLCVTFSPDGQSVLTGGLDGTISTWAVQ